VNIYRRTFYCKCPNNSQLIEYHFELMTDKMVQVEDIVEFCDTFDIGYHEAIAEKLVGRFGGRQVLKAHHHGVDVETRRDANEPVAGKLTERIIVGKTVYEKGTSFASVIDSLRRQAEAQQIADIYSGEYPR
jgi:hypothetical protein